MATAPAADDDGGSSPAASSPAASGSSSTPEPLTSGSSGASDAAGTYSMADVATHGDASSCWAAIDGKVYDLTSWIDRHPGGPDRILSLCGTDGTAAFTQQHGTQTRPNEMLASFYLGPLG